MTTALAKELSPQDKQLQTIATYITARKDALAQVIANGLSAERLVKIICAAASRTPKLLQCTPASIYSCLHTSAQLGLELGGPLKHAHPVPFYNKRANNGQGAMECTLIVGYEGYLELVRRTGQVATIYAEAVRQGDVFDHELGLHRDIKHKRKAAFDGGKNVIAAYAVAHLKDGGHQLCVMMRDEIEAIRDRSKAREDGPWISDFEEMAKKTAIRRLQKYLPKSTETAEALQHDDAGDVSVTVLEPTGNELPAPAADPLKERLKAALPEGDAKSVGDMLRSQQAAQVVTANVPTAQAVAETKTRRKKATPEPGTQINPASPAETAAGKPESTPAPAATTQTPPVSAAPKDAPVSEAIESGEPVAADQLDLYIGVCVNISGELPNGLYKFTFDDNSVFYAAGLEFTKGMHKYRQDKTKLDIGFLHDAGQQRDMIKSVSIHEGA